MGKFNRYQTQTNGIKAQTMHSYSGDRVVQL